MTPAPRALPALALSLVAALAAPAPALAQDAEPDDAPAVTREQARAATGLTAVAFTD